MIRLPKRIGGIDHLIGIGLGVFYVAWLLSTARGLGFARDEGFYFHASSDYARWFDLLSKDWHSAVQRENVDPYWASNHEHPSLMKGLFALSYHFLYEKHHVFTDASTAFRFPGMVMSGVALWITYLFGARAYSRKAGLAGALGLALMPRIFYHAHLACFDVPIMAMWLACVYVYWRSLQEGGIGWAIWAGVMYGLTLETKHNAWILPAVFIPHAIISGIRAKKTGKGRVAFPSSILAMATIGPMVFIWLWPWLWNDTLPRIQEYVNFHTHHEYYNIEFLHETYFGPPSPKAYAPTMIAVTVPTVTLVLFFIGAFDRLRAMARRLVGASVKSTETRAPADEPRDIAQTDLLLFLAFSAPLAVFFLKTTPIFGGTKHWLPAYPLLCIFAGRGFELVARALVRALPEKSVELRQQLAQVALAAVLLAPPLAEVVHSHPFGLGFYNPYSGGTAGGADLGMCRQFWGYTTESLKPYFDENAPPNARVYVHDTAWDSWIRLTAEKRIRPDLQGVWSPSDAQISLLHHETHMNEVDFQNWVVFGPAPDYVLVHDGVPFVSVYRKK